MGGKFRPSPPRGIRSPDRPARSQSLYRLSYPAHDSIINIDFADVGPSAVFDISMPWFGGGVAVFLRDCAN
jgi:hypothetical protein